jgi:carbamoyltransferase
MGLQSYGNVDNNYLKYLEKFNIHSTKEIFNVENWEKYVGDKLLANHNLLTWISTVHERIGDVLLDYFKKYADKTDIISYTGGVAQNVIWNTKLKNYFPNLIIPPHCADDGLSLGAIEWLRIKHNLPKFHLENFPFCQTDIAPDSTITDESIDHSAELLSKGKTVAWYQGNGEIGPRALGNRSIFLDPRIENGKEIINSIKNRELYRPFGAVVLEEYRHLFNLEYENPHMLYVGTSDSQKFPSITHVDGTCRIQTIKNENTNLRRLLEKFYKITGCPVLLNTSLNLAGKPIAGNPKDAVKLFYESSLEALVVGNEIFIK